MQKKAKRQVPKFDRLQIPRLDGIDRDPSDFSLLIAKMRVPALAQLGLKNI